MPSIDRLGTVLLHFLWQGLLIAAVYGGLRASAGRATPSTRYLLACVALGAMLAAPLATWTLLAPGPAASTPETLARWAAPPAYSPTAPIHAVDFGSAPAAGYLPWVVAIWLAGATALSLRLLGASIFALRLRSRNVRPAPLEWQLILDRLRVRLHLAQPVRLLVSAVADIPAVVGWLRPVVLVPAASLAGLPADHLEALLLHELAHIRRHDALVNLAQSVAEILLFYHPAVWWISSHIRAEREHCCDDLAVATTGDILSYARALAGMESARRSRFRPALAATGGPLAARIARLLGQPRRVSGPAPAAIVPIIAAAAAAIYGQAQDHPKFAVASVKPSTEQSMRFVRPMPGGRLLASAPLRLLIQNAYSIQAYQVVGGPAWIDDVRYQIEARTQGNPSREQLLEMLQPLLQDRFQLQTHRETRELPVYALVPARRGVKLPAPAESGCTPPSLNTPPDWAGGRIAPPTGSSAPAPPCGAVRVVLVTSGAHLQGGRVPMAELVRTLAMITGRPVLDRTGIAALFDVSVDFLADAVTPALPPPPPGSALDTSPTVPSIVTALQEQLGLKLEATKGPVEVLMIDHVERPTAN